MNENSSEDAPELLDLRIIKRPKTPLIRQSERKEGGLAALCMVMASFGGVIDLPSLRQRHPLSGQGASLARLSEIAEKEGFLLLTSNVTANELVRFKLPAILHWTGNHSVVLTDYSVGKTVTLLDPAVGERTLSWPEFVDGFAGTVSELEPLATMKPKVQTTELSVIALLKKTQGYVGMLAKAFILALLVETMLLLSPMLLQTIVDEVIPVGDDRLLWSLSAGFAGIALIKTALTVAQGWLGMVLIGLVSLSMKQLTFGHLLKLPLKWFEKRGVGFVTSKFMSLHGIRGLLTENLLMTLVDSVVAALMLVVLLAYEWRLALLTFAVSGLMLLTSVMVNARYAAAAVEAVRADDEENNLLVESVSAIPAIKMFGQELRQLRNYRASAIASTNRLVDVQRLKTLQTGLQTLMTALGDVVLVTASGYMVIHNTLSLGVMFGFYAYKQILTQKLVTLSTSFLKLKYLKIYVNSLGDILSSPVEATSNQILTVSARPALHFEKVCFTYDEADNPTLKDFDLTVRPGEIVGLTGLSGGGKSTLIKLLTGALEPSRGSIRLDGNELVGVPPKCVREHLGVVLQSDHLLTGTLVDNITMFETDPDMERVKQAVADAAFIDDVADLPTGLDTFLLGHAPALSGGQKQRLVLARAFYKNAAVLVLDEATSALDLEREIHVCDAIRRKGLTTLMIAHRQETLARCDRVVRLD